MSPRRRTLFPPAPPVRDGTHPGTKSVETLHRLRADLEGSEIEISRRPGGAPSRVLTFDIDDRHTDSHVLGAKRGDIDREGVADLQPREQIFAEIEGEPDVIEID